MQLVKNILSLVANVSAQDVKSPDSPVQNGERVIGVVPDELRALYWLMTNTEANVDETHARLEEEFAQADEVDWQKCHAFSRECILVILMKDIFWESVRYHFPEVTPETMLEIRSGWQIVACDPQIPFIKTLMSNSEVQARLAQAPKQ